MLLSGGTLETQLIQSTVRPGREGICEGTFSNVSSLWRRHCFGMHCYEGSLHLACSRTSETPSEVEDDGTRQMFAAETRALETRRHIYSTC